ncbi:HAD-IIB family hydrolase [Sphingomonas sp. Leaf4]|uniref:HAD-IIB family hydrolase n=1 Tax=Sphingomonas sp. Leaf4 TaxID=2876553 RepID=UPI001E2A4156|nr:HAD-IIB family hydrolase [Sphingomonas sp. Leaf4]
MFILHLALQGCLRAREVEYGVTADTGGHIRYLLDLVTAGGRHPDIERQEIVTRAFRGGPAGERYWRAIEPIDATTRLVRLRSASDAYMAKEALWAEHETTVDALVAHIATLDRRPDLIHAHYADAGAVAAAIRDRLGIPYLFTAHSLGRVKRTAFGTDCAETQGIDRRIAIEDRAIAGAAAIIASSRDEAEVQYAGYPSYDPGRIRIIPPGSDLALFAGTCTDTLVDARIDRFLADPTKPAILAIARPVSKKNLAALVHAYGRCPALQTAANLVIVAGTRDDPRSLEPELAGNMAELFALIDRYDLYGSVALPKSHAPHEVPAIYAYARARRGVFVNPALNEPFGLTLLEAAASGLPLVATDSGGPNDIIEGCGNGILVDPRDPHAIGQAVLKILSDDMLWDRYSQAGAVAARLYDWDGHVERYVELAQAVIAPPAPVMESPRLLLVSDIDNTLLGEAEAAAAFNLWHGDQRDMAFGIATGRSLHSALAILAQNHVAPPAVMITSVGSEIYHHVHGGVYARDDAWTRRIDAGWDRAAIARLLATVADLRPQSPLEQRSHKLSYFTGGEADITERVRDLLAAAGVTASVIHSHGRYLDVLPLAASKGTAVEYVRQHHGLRPDQVIVAGDSGNDVEMLRACARSIIVGNYSDGLAQRADLAHSYVARTGYAFGIMEGVAHFRAQPDRRLIA